MQIVEKDRAVFKITDRETSEADYLLMVKEAAKGGYKTGSVADKWRVLGFGWEYSLWPTIGERAGLCEVGRLYLGHDLPGIPRTTMEDYVKIYREVIKCARKESDLFAQFAVSVRITMQDGGVTAVKDKYERESLGKFLAGHQPVFTEEGQGDAVRQSAAVSITSVGSLKAAYGLSHYFPGPDAANKTVEIDLRFDEPVSVGIGVAGAAREDA